mmetsp:Transcript_13236/g.40034  ORF Transcript_13236/g.40034 Transcript_13236/m.40034 type:complete len:252 (-) Transcript_13236:112-867(-)
MEEVGMPGRKRGPGGRLFLEEVRKAVGTLLGRKRGRVLGMCFCRRSLVVVVRGAVVVDEDVRGAVVVGDDVRGAVGRVGHDFHYLAGSVPLVFQLGHARGHGVELGPELGHVRGHGVEGGLMVGVLVREGGVELGPEIGVLFRALRDNLRNNGLDAALGAGHCAREKSRLRGSVKFVANNNRIEFCRSGSRFHGSRIDGACRIEAPNSVSYTNIPVVGLGNRQVRVVALQNARRALIQFVIGQAETVQLGS